MTERNNFFLPKTNPLSAIARTRIKQMKKKKGICHFANCKKIATYGFRERKSDRMQQQTYCREHAYLVKSYKAFPNCRVIQLKYKDIILSPNIMDELDFISKRKQREIIKQLLIKGDFTPNGVAEYSHNEN